MGKNIPQKIIADHLISGKMTSGSEISIRIDQTLTQDATGTMAYLEFETLKISQVKTELSVSYVDHNTLQNGFENADDHNYLRSAANKFGIYFSRPGNGICHQVHLERFGIPGKTLIGSDSHTPTGGGLGMIAIGAGGLDVATAMGGQPFHMNMPEVIRINLHNKLRPWVTAKDIILKVLSLLTTKGNVGRILEYGGDGINHLTVPERATITNMGAELGVTTSVFPSDHQTRNFMKAQGRGGDWKEILSDQKAAYEKTFNIDLAFLEPMVAQPHSPDNICSISEIKGMKVDQVAIGSCTNSSYTDLMTVARILKGKKVHPETSLIIAPGSKQVLEMIDRAGALSDILSSGARLMENTCGFCIGNGQSPSSGGISARTNNRNFKGRSGTQDAGIYLVSPPVAALAAIEGCFTDPLEIKRTYPSISMPKKFLIDDSMVLVPSKDSSNIKILRGPNIGDPPFTDPTADSYQLKSILKVEDKITTDHIMPAGQRLKYRSNIAKYSEFVFENIDPDFSVKAIENKKNGFMNMIIAGESYGQGSSREHAAICPAFLGVKIVLARSMERIHKANLVNFGIIPLLFLSQDDYEWSGMNEEWEVHDLLDCLTGQDNIILKNKSQNRLLKTKLELSERERNIIIEGGFLNLIRKTGQSI